MENQKILCPLCDWKTFRSEAGLKLHNVRVHEAVAKYSRKDVLNFSCIFPECSRKCHTAQSLKDHENFDHQRLKFHDCLVCKAKFGRNADLLNHWHKSFRCSQQQHLETLAATNDMEEGVQTAAVAAAIDHPNAIPEGRSTEEVSEQNNPTSKVSTSQAYSPKPEVKTTVSGDHINVKPKANKRKKSDGACAIAKRIKADKRSNIRGNQEPILEREQSSEIDVPSEEPNCVVQPALDDVVFAEEHPPQIKEEWHQHTAQCQVVIKRENAPQDRISATLASEPTSTNLLNTANTDTPLQSVEQDTSRDRNMHALLEDTNIAVVPVPSVAPEPIKQRHTITTIKQENLNGLIHMPRAAQVTPETREVGSAWINIKQEAIAEAESNGAPTEDHSRAKVQFYPFKSDFTLIQMSTSELHKEMELRKRQKLTLDQTEAILKRLLDYITVQKQEVELTRDKTKFLMRTGRMSLSEVELVKAEQAILAKLTVLNRKEEKTMNDLEYVALKKRDVDLYRTKLGIALKDKEENSTVM